MSTLAKRLTAERERLHLSPKSLGDMAAVADATQLQLEAGELEPTPYYWQAVSQLGVDVAYVLAGVRSSNVATTPREIALLDNYRHCPVLVQDEVSKNLAVSGRAWERSQEVDHG
ncbi:hypothetical protein NP590_04020 [Methylomonas sp. SURF-2]|uniref:HTH cro/C1-type domain-containing protein n=1 Tax=Methylomonas subterranea TaxID=2952225 RepID=A0ABT1TET1_9GAMM|nr:hypothetical protein [Methylomonas sp. SURF-2]MCQ8103264.1 hypothetical protein [Methylomonas sp. SURF-2]